MHLLLEMLRCHHWKVPPCDTPATSPAAVGTEAPRGPGSALRRLALPSQAGARAPSRAGTVPVLRGKRSPGGVRPTPQPGAADPARSRRAAPGRLRCPIRLAGAARPRRCPSAAARPAGPPSGGGGERVAARRPPPPPPPAAGRLFLVNPPRVATGCERSAQPLVSCRRPGAAPRPPGRTLHGSDSGSPRRLLAAPCLALPSPPRRPDGPLTSPPPTFPRRLLPVRSRGKWQQGEGLEVTAREQRDKEAAREGEWHRVAAQLRSRLCPAPGPAASRCSWQVGEVALCWHPVQLQAAEVGARGQPSPASFL